MNILLLTPFFPYPADSGGNTRTLNLLIHLKRHGVRVVLGLVTTESISTQHWNDFHKLLPHVKTIQLPFSNSLRNKASYFALSLTGADRLLSYREVKHRIRNLVEEEDIDIVHADYSQAARFLPHGLQVPTILAYIEFRTRVLDRESVSDLTSQGRIVGVGRRMLIRHEELSHGSRYDSVICMSEEDRRWLLKRRPGLEVSVIENGVDTKTYSYQPPRESIRGIYYIGWFTNQQNCHALDFFVNTAWPGLKQHVRDFVVIGKDLDPRRQTMLAEQGISYLGYLHQEELREKTTGRALVVPLRSGSGTRLKILEAMAMGNPVISTAIGIEGIRAEEGKHYLHAETAKEFQEEIHRLRSEPFRCSQIASEARNLVEREYDWTAISRRLWQCYEKLLTTTT